MAKTLHQKKQRARLLLDTAMRYAHWVTPHYSSWLKQHDGTAFHHWKKKDLSFIGNRAMFLAHQGQNKGYRVGATQSGAYYTLCSLASGCYFYTNPRVDPGPMRPFFLTELLVRR